MTETAIAYSNLSDSRDAARALAAQLSNELHGAPDALIVFAAPTHDHPRLLNTLQTELRPKAMVGASSAGEFTSSGRGEGMTCALGIRSDSMSFSAALGTGLDRDRAAVAQQLVGSFHGL